MNAAIVAAIISGAVALVSAILSVWTQLRVTELESKLRAEECQAQAKSQAKDVLDRCRGPLLDAAWQLGDRVDNLRNSEDFRAYLTEGNSRAQHAQLTTLFRFAHYLGWREFVRIKVQLLQFEKEEDTKTTAWLLNDLTWVLASDELDRAWAMLWGDEQRAIGELMTERPPGASSFVSGHAAFSHDYCEVFAPWMSRFADDLFSDTAPKSDRLRLLQWALYGLVQQLDEEGVYGIGWINRTAAEIQGTPQGSTTRYEDQIRCHIELLTHNTS
jgi:hypothetical protein